MGRGREAISALKIARHLSAGSVSAVAGLGYAYAMTDQEADARVALAELGERAAREYVSPLRVAQIHVGLGEREEALSWLEQAVEGRDVGLALLNVQRGFRDLEGDPRFEAIRANVMGPG